MEIMDAVISSKLPVEVEIKPSGGTDAEWKELDRGPGVIRIPAGHEVRIRIRNIGDVELGLLIEELVDCPVVTHFNLAENRNVTDEGLAMLTRLTGIKGLNLSSCYVTNKGLEKLRLFHHLEWLNLSYCNRITDLGLKPLRFVKTLSFLDLQGIPKITNGGLAKLRHNGLTIHR
jgi:hypothetical protein